jgi:hypothetical protein
MSRHFYDCTDSRGRPIRVQLGFDRPLQEFFMHIYLRGEHEPLYASINDPYDTRELAYYNQKLAELSLVVPLTLWLEAIDDAARNTGNRCAQHFLDGRVVEDVFN